MIGLRAFKEEDFDQLMAWIPSKEMLAQFAGNSFDFPLTHAQLTASLTDSRRLAYTMTMDPGDIPAGHAEIFFSAPGNCLLCRILIGDPAFRNRGLGSEAVAQLLEICFTRQAIETTTLYVFDWNHAAIRCYEKAGFRVDESKTTIRQLTKTSWRVLQMRLSREDWQLNHSILPRYRP